MDLEHPTFLEKFLKRHRFSRVLLPHRARLSRRPCSNANDPTVILVVRRGLAVDRFRFHLRDDCVEVARHY